MYARWAIFAEEYLRDWNATQAAIRAGYSTRSAYARGYELRHKPEVEEYIQRRLTEMQMETDEILVRLTDMARSSIEVFLNFDSGTWKIDLAKAREAGKLHLIKSTKPTTHGIAIEMHDPLKALELLGRAKKLFTDNLKVDAPLSVTVTGLDAILDRVYGKKDDNSSGS